MTSGRSDGGAGCSAGGVDFMAVAPAVSLGEDQASTRRKPDEDEDGGRCIKDDK